MPLSELGSLESRAGFGEFGQMVIRVEGQEISIWKSYSYNSHFLTETDVWRFDVGDEQLSPELRALLVPGNRCEFFIDGVKQASGYIDKISSDSDRSTGLVLHIEGRDTLSPLVDSQINPDKHFPDKTTLEKLIVDIIQDYGFTDIFLENDVDVRLGKKGVKKRKHHKKGDTFLKGFPLPKKKPQHNDRVFAFLSRITQRYGFWIWPTVDGDGLIVGKPDYEQDPSGQLRWKFDGKNNNIKSGGITRDATGQPSFIVATGDIPGVGTKHQKTRVVLDNPYVAGLEFGLSFQEQSDDFHQQSLVGDGSVVDRFQNAKEIKAGTVTDKVDQFGLGDRFVPGSPDRSLKNIGGDITPPGASEIGIRENQDKNLLGHDLFAIPTETGTLHTESGTFIDTLKRYRTEVIKEWTTFLTVKPIKLINTYACKVSRPVFLKDPDSHTREELERFARRQMSLYARKAFVARYEIMGHKIDGNIVQVDTIIDVEDEAFGHTGPLWVLSRTFLCSRQGGLTTSLELIPINALAF